MPKSKPPYPAVFRQQIIELARAGRTLAQLSREFGPTAKASPTGWPRMHAILASRCPARKA